MQAQNMFKLLFNQCEDAQCCKILHILYNTRNIYLFYFSKYYIIISIDIVNIIY